jgi:Tol biopolymer transport system component
MGFFAVGGATLAYVEGAVESPRRELVALDPDGERTVAPAPPRFYRNIAVAPAGGRAAVTILDGRRSDIWLVGLVDGGLERLTFEGFNIEPAWSADGRWLAFASRGDQGPFQMYRRPADGGMRPQRLQESPRHQYPEAFTPDGRTLVYTENHPETGFDLWLLRLEGPEPRSRPLLRTPANEFLAAVSPDGRHLAYTSDESGQLEIYVQALPGPGGKWQVSPQGGVIPFWSPRGDRLYYHHDGLKTVAVAAGAEFAAGPPTAVAGVQELVAAWAGGDQLVAIEERSPPSPPRELRVVVGFDPRR